MSLIDRVVDAILASGRSSTSFEDTGSDFDYSLGGLGLLAAATPQNPYQRSTAPYRKQQVDQEAEPGEQSLGFWWQRAQSSFHAGAGQTFRDSGDADSANPRAFRFLTSTGVNPWTPGQVSLLNDTASSHTSANATQNLVTGLDSDGVGFYLHSDGSNLNKVKSAVVTPITWGGANSIVSLTDDGSNYYAADSVGIYKGANTPGAGAKIWNTGSASVTIGWLKQRLMAGIANKVYELDATGAGGPTLPTAKFTHQNTAWTWTSFAETPRAILASGFSGGSSAIYKFVLDSGGAVPTLTTGTVVTQLPAGEICHSMFSYLGAYVALGTNKGLRIATIADDGESITYGPLLFTTTSAVLALTANDRFIYAGVSGNGSTVEATLVRVDLGLTTGFGSYAYANDLVPVTGSGRSKGVVKAIGLVGARMAICVSSEGVALEGTAAVASGTLTTSRIRFNTLDPKIYRIVNYRADGTAGSIAVAINFDADSGGSSLYTLALSSDTVSGDLTIDATPADFVTITFTLTAGASSPVLTNWQIKALPGQRRQRLFTVPILCFDRMKDRAGNEIGGDSYALGLIRDLEAMEESGDVVTFQHLNCEDSDSTVVVIDELQFTQTAPPGDCEGFGGILTATLRSVS